MQLDRPKRIAIIAAICGIALEVIAIVLLGSGRITMTYAAPMITIGMFLAFVPIFVVARRSRKR